MKVFQFKKPDAWNGTQDAAARKRARNRMLIIIGLTLLLLVIYFTVNTLVDRKVIAVGWGYAVMIIYKVTFAGLLIGYVIYNRAFILTGVTVEMLANDWTDEKKQAFVDRNRARKEKSRWVLYLLIPFIFVFLADALYLFVWTVFLEPYFT